MSLAAQGAVSPFTFTNLRSTNALGASALQVTAVKTYSAIQLAGDAPGVYYIGITVLGLSTARGGVGGNDLITGRYDAVQGTFTEDLAAASLNTAGSEFCMSLHASGLIAVTDRNGGGTTIGVARRTSLNAPFAYVGNIAGLAANPFYDPAIATVNGQLQLVYTEGRSIVMRSLDINTLQTGPARVIANSRSATGYPSSVQPITDTNGEMIGVTYSDDWPAQSDVLLALDLDPATPPQMLVDVSGDLFNGCLIGAQYFAPGYASPTTVADFVLGLGGRAAIGTTMDVAAYVPATPVAAWSSALLLSAAYVSPTAIPGINGFLGVDAATSVVLPFGAHAANSGRASLQIPVPNAAHLAGITVPAQILSARAATAVYLANTCALVVR